MKDREESRFFASLKRASGVAWQGLEYRFDLFATEFREDRRRLIVLAVLAQVALFAAFMSFVCLNVFVFVIFWDTHRIAVAVILSSLYLAVTIATIACIRWRSKTAPRPFQASLEELRKDRAALTGINRERSRASQAAPDPADRESS
jgi:uncharacterized membrane protein YqjE